eukprot:443763_1
MKDQRANQTDDGRVVVGDAHSDPRGPDYIAPTLDDYNNGAGYNIKMNEEVFLAYLNVLCAIYMPADGKWNKDGKWKDGKEEMENLRLAMKKEAYVISNRYSASDEGKPDQIKKHAKRKKKEYTKEGAKFIAGKAAGAIPFVGPVAGEVAPYLVDGILKAPGLVKWAKAKWDAYEANEKTKDADTSPVNEFALYILFHHDDPSPNGVKKSL